jgi:type IV pilus assembly protein PilM
MKLPDFFGLDIGNHTIKLAQADHNGEEKAKLKAIGMIDTEYGVLAVDDANARINIANKVKELRDITGVGANKVVIGLPEASIFNRLILLPDLSEEEMEEAVYYEAQQYLPTPVSEAQIDYIPISKVNIEGKNLVRALLVAAPKILVNRYVEVMALADLELIGVETESVATARTLTFGREIDGNILILDFGGAGTDISVVKSKKLIFSQSIGTGSDALTKTIAADFSLDNKQAEQYKRTYGLLPNQAEGKIARSLDPIMQVIVNEINKTINYFRSHLQEGTPKQIFMVGDGAKLPGLGEYITRNIGIACQLADPVSMLDMNSSVQNQLTKLSSVGFTVSVGLALKQQ